MRNRESRVKYVKQAEHAAEGYQSLKMHGETFSRKFQQSFGRDLPSRENKQFDKDLDHHLDLEMLIRDANLGGENFSSTSNRCRSRTRIEIISLTCYQRN